MRRCLCGLVHLSAPTYLLSGSGVVLSRASEVTVRLISVGTASASRGIISYIFFIFIIFNSYYLHIYSNYFCSRLWRSIRNCLCLGSRKRIRTGDNIIRRMWTDGMSCLHEIRMKKNGMRRTMGGIDGGLTSMEPLTNHLRRLIQYLLYHRQWRSLTWATFLTYLTDSARYIKIYKIYISICTNR
jgi:hypothetical protein